MATLSEREAQIAERIAWGASQKEVACDLGISRYTVDNILRKIYQKLHIGKVNELSAWWFCTHFNISFELSPLKRAIGAIALLMLVILNDFISGDTYCRNRSKKVRTEVCVRFKETV
ncbi:helix-turn-helix transcriptional regulator [Bacteroides stercoris]|nr:helix-turn-helix transcriptional regulator [Bacteroides stercoris]